MLTTLFANTYSYLYHDTCMLRGTCESVLPVWRGKTCNKRNMLSAFIASKHQLFYETHLYQFKHVYDSLRSTHPNRPLPDHRCGVRLIWTLWPSRMTATRNGFCRATWHCRLHINQRGYITDLKKVILKFHGLHNSFEDKIWFINVHHKNENK